MPRAPDILRSLLPACALAAALAAPLGGCIELSRRGAKPASGADAADTGAAADLDAAPANRPPTVATVRVLPEGARVGAPLTCQWTGYADPEGAPDASRFAWLVDGVPVPAAEGLVAPPGGTLVTCRVTPFDGEVEGTPVDGDLVVANTAPTVAAASLTPDPPRAGDTLRCGWTGFEDPDGDPDASEVAWLVNGLPAGAGPTLAGAFARGDEVTCRVVPRDGHDAGPAVTATAVVANSAPRLGAAAIAPAEPRAGDRLTCGWTGFHDPDGDPDRSRVRWEIDGAPAGDGPTLAAGFRRGDEVTCTVTPSDGDADGRPATAKAAIGNAPPTVDLVTLGPPSPSAGQALTCTWSGFLDADGDADASRVLWRVNGVPAGTGPALAAPTAHGDEVTCRVTPWDGLDAGPPVTRAVTLGNATPTLAAAVITPDPAFAGSTLACHGEGFADADGDPDLSLVAWAVDGVVTAVGPVLPGPFAVGQDVRCRVTPWDGKSHGAPVEATLTIRNTVPGVAGVTIEPALVTEHTAATCAWSTFWDADGDPDLSTVRWTVGGEPAGVGPVLAAGFEPGDVLACTVTPFDGLEAGPPITAQRVVGNAAPSLSGATILPWSPTAADVLICQGKGYADPEGAADHSLVRWYVDGALAGEGSALAGAAAAGDVVTCEVTPFDGASMGAPVLATVTLRNAPPTVASAAITPAVVRAGDRPVCTWAGFADADGHPDQSRVTWRVGGKPAGEGPLFTGPVVHDDVLSCTVEPWDGEDAGPTVKASVIVANTAPSLASAAVSPPSPRAGDAVTCAWDGYADADGEADASFARWWVDGAAAGEGPTLPVAVRAGLVVTCEAVPFDGTDEGTPVAATVTVANTPPSLAAAALEPAVLHAGDPVTCRGVAFADPDGHPDLSTAAWWIDGAPAGDGPVLAAAPPRGSLVACEVTPFDGLDAGEPRGASAVVQNAPPSLAGATLTPAAPAAGEALTCSGVGYLDADGDPGTLEIRWTVNGAEAGTGPVLAGGAVAGDVVTCVVTPHDGLVAGPSAQATAVVANGAPQVGAVWVSPAVPRAGDALTCTWDGFSDPEGAPDASQVAWTVDGAPAGAGAVLAAPLAHGQAVTCTVTPFDGQVAGEPASASVTVANTPPAAQAAALAPAVLRAGKAATCGAVGFADADGEPDASLVAWAIDGVPAGTGPTLAGAWVQGDEVRCVVTPHDGTDAGPPVEAATVVANTPPTAAGAALTPATPRAGDTVRCDAVGFADADGHADASTATWTVDGAPAGAGPVLTAAFARGQVVACTLTPSDGIDAGPPRLASATVANTAPSVADVAIAFAGTVAALEATCTWAFADADGDADHSTVAWRRGGAQVGQGPVYAGTLNPGEAITCVVTPSDGIAAGTPASATATWGNTPPTLEAAAISPSVLRAGATATCAGVGYDDAQGDPDQSVVSWEVNDAPAGGGATLKAPLVAGDVVRCTVTPFDGTDSGEPRVAEATVANTAPALGAAAISPSPATAAGPLTCTWSGWVDPDGDPDLSTARWRVGGVDAGSGKSLAGGFARGDAVTCEVTAFDGEDEGNAVSATVTVANAVPTVASAALSPAKPTVADLLTCSYAGFFDADGDADASTFAWKVDGEPLSVAGPVAGPFAAGQQVSCIVTPHDGLAAGLPRGATVTISAAPLQLSAAIEPAAPTAATPLTCAWTVTGGKGDEPPPDVVWLVGGTKVAAGDTLASGYARGDVVTCEATAPGGPKASASATILNAPPVLTEVTLGPLPLRTDDTAVVTAVAADADGDTVKLAYAWKVDGVVLGAKGTTLSGTLAFERGQVVSATVTATDGHGGSAAATVTRVVANSPPTAPLVAVEPGPIARDQEDLKCRVEEDAVDPDGDPVSYQFAWRVNGEAWSGTGDEVPDEATAQGDDWTCRVVALDGIDAGPAGEALAEVAVELEGSTGPGVKKLRAKEGPYLLTGDVFVPEGGWLQIEGGVTVLGEGRTLRLGRSSSLFVGEPAQPRAVLEDVRIEADATPGGEAADFWLVITNAVLRGGSVNSEDALPYAITALSAVFIDVDGPLGCHLPARDCLFVANVFVRSGGLSSSQGSTFGGYTTFQANTVVEQSTPFAVEKTGGPGVYFLVHGNSFLSTDRVAVRLAPGGGEPFDAGGNWWGTTGPVAIQAMVFDAADSGAVAGMVPVEPWLTAPNAAAPDATPWLE